MSAVPTPRVQPRLGARTGAVTPGAGSSLRSVAVGLGLLVPSALALGTDEHPSSLLALTLVLAVVGVLALAAAVIELVPTPGGRLTFHEHGLVERRADGMILVHLDGTTRPTTHHLPATASHALRAESS